MSSRGAVGFGSCDLMFLYDKGEVADLSAAERADGAAFSAATVSAARRSSASSRRVIFVFTELLATSRTRTDRFYPCADERTPTVSPQGNRRGNRCHRPRLCGHQGRVVA
jgi:hypothetical protein